MIRNLILLLIISSILPAHAARPIVSAVEMGKRQIKAGKHQQAFNLWYAVGSYGPEPDVQYALSDMLDHSKATLKLPGLRADIANRMLLLAAVNGYRPAQSKLAYALRAGRPGIIADETAAKCWEQELALPSAPEKCLARTATSTPKARPACSQLIAKLENSADGRKAAELCLANGLMALQAPGLPPSDIYESDVAAHEAYGIEWIIVGDAPGEHGIAFMESFDSAMDQAIRAKWGEDVYERITADAERRLQAFRVRKQDAQKRK
ncbi:hypothetical protein GM658_02110 [Pseudoduganella eburnea]|uniref:Sel1 repeat family protein n=1 Tax=Massilia eburnea TaxID=1776165 RepID=A0A6L6QAF6_9BURK|nr:hypothetical protein [Massilia eburnea]MTW09382.1 hypothetical protein [Massilia eburnea]